MEKHNENTSGLATETNQTAQSPLAPSAENGAKKSPKKAKALPPPGKLTQTHKPPRYLLPKALSLEQIKKLKPATRKEFRRYTYKEEKLIYLVHVIARGVAYCKSSTDGNAWVHLYSPILKKIVGTAYPGYIRLLKREGIIIENPKSYSVGGSSKSYTFTKKYLGDGFQMVEYKEGRGIWSRHKTEFKTTSQKVVHIKEGSKDNIEDIIEKTSINDSFLLQENDFNKLMSYLQGLQVDREEALNSVQAIFKAAKPEKKRRTKKAKHSDGKVVKHSVSYTTNPKLAYVQACAQIELLHAGLNDEIQRDDSIGRLYSPLVLTSKTVRPYITYKGTPLGYIDVKNAQPFLVVALFNPSFWYSQLPHLTSLHTQAFPHYDLNNEILNIDKIGYAQYLFPADKLGRLRYLKVLDAVKKCQGAADAMLYRKSVQSGSFYQDMASLLNIDQDAIGNWKAHIKEILFTVLFTANQFIGQLEAKPKRVFRDIYPSVYELLCAIKYGKGNAPKLPRLLQRLESHIMIDMAAAYMVKHHPQVPYFTIHDAAATPYMYMHLAKRLVEQSLGQAIGLIPAFHLEILTPKKPESLCEDCHKEDIQAEKALENGNSEPENAYYLLDHPPTKSTIPNTPPPAS